MSPRFSILLPTHNRADVVGYAIASVLQQIERDFELLVVGDGCTDDTAAVVQGFDDPRIRWFDLPKAPHFGYANRNVALREARGELIGFMAHDDLMTSDHLALLARPFERDEVEWAYSRPVWVSRAGVVVPFAVDLRKPDQLNYFLTKRNTIPASCVMHRRECFERYGYWPEDVPRGADWALWKNMVGPSRGSNLAYVPLATALHFRANWRTGTDWGPPPLSEWLAVASDQDAWPNALKIPVLDDETEQAAAWRLLEAPTSWTARFRDGIADALELLAWHTGLQVSQAVRIAKTVVRQCLRREEYDEVRTIANEALLLAPTDAELCWLYGAALIRRGDFAGAEVQLRRAIELDPLFANAYGQLSQAVNRLGRANEAIAIALRGIECRPDHPGLHRHLGNLFVRQGRWQEAEASLREALRLDPKLDSAAQQLRHVVERQEATRS